MKQISILRHAKSAWTVPGQADIERPLNGRGNKQLAALARWIKQSGHRPDLVLYSPAKRTRETIAALDEALGSPEKQEIPKLYMGSIQTYIDALAGFDDREHIMIVGHNPTSDELTRYLAAESSPEYRKLVSHHFGTANLAVLSLDIEEWTDLKTKCGQLTAYLRPKELME